jgi:hypothetical protein
MPRSSQWSLAFGPPNENPVNTSPLPHACHMSSPTHSPLFNHPNNIRWRIQAVKFRTLYGTRKFITVFTRSLKANRFLQFPTSYNAAQKSNLWYSCANLMHVF